MELAPNNLIAKEYWNMTKKKQNKADLTSLHDMLNNIENIIINITGSL